MAKFTAIAQLKTAEQFRDYLKMIGVPLNFDEKVEYGEHAPLALPFTLPDGFVIGNRFCIQPMEGWDGTPDGKPTEYTIRRWRNFGLSGAKLIWGGEAVAVRHDGRANPNQLLINRQNQKPLFELQNTLIEAHRQYFGQTDDLLIGLQLTHSGRFARPNSKTQLEPLILYHHAYLDKKFGISANYPILGDDQIEEIISAYVEGAIIAAEIGFKFVDIKHCHGYLGHEFLSAVNRPGRFGGSFENRTLFLRLIVEGIKKAVPEMRVGVRLSAFDLPAFQPDKESGIGVPVQAEGYPFRFGGDEKLGVDLTEPKQFLEVLRELGINLVNLTAGSPYYNPHIQRPALFPPSDGYLPPEDPLEGVARQINTTALLKQTFPDLGIVGTAYSYLQDWLPNVAQYYVRHGLVDFIGLGRMVLAYPDFPVDVLTGKPVDRRRLCRTFSDCTTAPRNGLVSGCYPIDPYYKHLPEAKKLAGIKKK